MPLPALKLPATIPLNLNIPYITARKNISESASIPEIIWDFINAFETKKTRDKIVNSAQSLFGYTTYDAVQFFETVHLSSRSEAMPVPLMRYRLYQYLIVINHFKNEMFICENKINGLQSEIVLIESLIRSKDVPVFPFHMQEKRNFKP